MDTAALRRALLATARIAGTVALAGCAPTLAQVAPVPTGTASPDVPDDTDTGDAEEPATCPDLLDELVADTEAGLDPFDADAETAACCEELIADIDATGEWPTTQEDSEEMWACCHALGWPTSMACTPWGPPAPPAMRPVLEAAA